MMEIITSISGNIVDIVSVNAFQAKEKRADDFTVERREGRIHVILARDGQLITGRVQEMPKVFDGTVVSDPSRDCH
jgi:adenine deaminase